MSLSVNTNIPSLKAHNALKNIGSRTERASQRLSSGLRINSAADDAAGVAISDKMRAQIRGLDQGQRNSQDGISLFQTADGALNEASSIAIRIRELSIQAINDTNTDEDRIKIEKEVQHLLAEVDGLADRTEFNKIKVLKEGMVTITNAFKSTNTLANMEGIIKTIVFTPTGTTNNSNQYVNIGEGASRFTLTVNIGDCVEAVYPDIYNFLQNEMYPLTQDSQDKFLNILVSGLNKGIQQAAAALNPSKNVASVVGEVNDEGKVVLGLADGTKLAVPSCNPGNDLSFGHQLLHMAFGSSNDPTSMSFYGQKSLYIQTGANTDQGETFYWDTLSAEQMGLKDVKLSPIEEAMKTLAKCDGAMAYVSNIRGDLGSYMNRLEYSMKSVQVSSDNLSFAKSSIADADMAKEMMEFTKANVLASASTSMLAQANQSPQMVLSLLQQ